MRIRIAAAAVLGTATVAGGALVVTGAGASPRPAEAVEGAGWVAFTDFPSPGETTVEQTIVSARIGPDGSPRGTLILRSPFGDVAAEVTCLVQKDEKTAYVGGRIIRGFVYLGIRMSHIVAGIEDNGQGKDPPDLMAGAIFRERADRPPGFDPCRVLLPFPPVYVVERGNYVVGNGPPASARVIE